MLEAILNTAFVLAGITLAIIVGYPLITALAYGIARSVLQAKKDHEMGKEKTK